MAYIDELRKSKDKAQVAFLEFSLSTRKYSNFFFCFFEGKDNPYYVPRIKHFTNEYYVIKCGNRDSVLKVRSLVAGRAEYSHYRKGFFIDRDFNGILPPLSPPVFETPCYSVENLYVSVNVFREILINEFHLSPVSDEDTFEASLSLYLDRQLEFHRETALFNAWYACLISNRNTTNIKTGVNLDDKLPKWLADISLQSVTSSYTIETIKQLFPDAIEVNDAHLEAILTFFQDSECHKIFRGKYELQFLLIFIELLIQDYKSSKLIFKSKISYAFGDRISNQQALSLFAGYAETPQSLMDYLEIVTKK